MEPALLYNIHTFYCQVGYGVSNSWIRRDEVVAKRAIVNNKLVETQAEVGTLTNEIARGCYLCNEE